MMGEGKKACQLKWEGFIVNSHIFALEKLPKGFTAKLGRNDLREIMKIKLKFNCHVMRPLLQR